MYYPKIDTLFNRGDNFKVDVNDYRRPEFEYVDNWLWMEKLDGSNISIMAHNLNGGGTIWRGRTPKSNFIPDIKNHLNLRVESWNHELQKVLEQHKLDCIEIFGEVYGPKIQNGGMYRDDIGTKFYDIRVNGNLWLDHKSVLEYGERLGFETPVYATNNKEDLIEFVRNGFPTFEGERITNPNQPYAEGIVAKTETPLYNNAGKRLIWKLKHKDFA